MPASFCSIPPRLNCPWIKVSLETQWSCDPYPFAQKCLKQSWCPLPSNIDNTSVYGRHHTVRWEFDWWYGKCALASWLPESPRKLLICWTHHLFTPSAYMPVVWARAATRAALEPSWGLFVCWFDSLAVCLASPRGNVQISPRSLWWPHYRPILQISRLQDQTRPSYWIC